MALHIFTSHESSPGEFFLDRYLGSALTLLHYWTLPGLKLGLPIISEMDEKANSEDGFSLSGADLIGFKDELEIFERYWMGDTDGKGRPDEFLPKIRAIIDGVQHAIENDLVLHVG